MVDAPAGAVAGASVSPRSRASRARCPARRPSAGVRAARVARPSRLIRTRPCDVDATRWFPAYVALGSNLDDPPAQVERAFTALAGLPRVALRAAVVALSIAAVRSGGAARFRQRGGWHADDARRRRDARGTQGARATPRSRATRRALGPAPHRPRPAGARHDARRRAATQGASSRHRGAGVRAGAACGDRAGPRCAGRGPGAGRWRTASIRPGCRAMAA